MPDMLLKNSHLWVDASLRVRYAAAALMLAVSFMLRWFLDDWLSPYLPTQFFLLSALLTALWFGYVPALISLVIGWVAGLYYFVEPYGQFSPANTYDIIVTVNDLASGIVGIAVIEYLQRTRYSKRLMLEVSESRYRSLLRLDNHRVHQQRMSTRALRQVSDILSHLDRVLLLINQEKAVFVQPLLGEVCGRASGSAAGNWLDLIHADDRKAVEQNIATVVEGLRESHELQFRLADAGQEARSLQCVFRALPIVARRSVFALMLKPDQSFHP